MIFRFFQSFDLLCYSVVCCCCVFFVFLMNDWVNNYPFLFSLSFDYEDAGYETSSLIRVSMWIWHRWTSVCLLFCCTGHTMSMILYVPTCLCSLLHSTMYVSRAYHIPCFRPFFTYTSASHIHPFTLHPTSAGYVIFLTLHPFYIHVSLLLTLQGLSFLSSPLWAESIFILII